LLLVKIFGSERIEWITFFDQPLAALQRIGLFGGFHDRIGFILLKDTVYLFMSIDHSPWTITIDYGH
jgi:hypothetical protein